MRRNALVLVLRGGQVINSETTVTHFRAPDEMGSLTRIRLPDVKWASVCQDRPRQNIETKLEGWGGINCLNGMESGFAIASCTA